jgi:hypothetical protein
MVRTIIVGAVVSVPSLAAYSQVVVISQTRQISAIVGSTTAEFASNAGGVFDRSVTAPATPGSVTAIASQNSLVSSTVFSGNLIASVVSTSPGVSASALSSYTVTFDVDSPTALMYTLSSSGTSVLGQLTYARNGSLVADFTLGVVPPILLPERYKLDFRISASNLEPSTETATFAVFVPTPNAGGMAAAVGLLLARRPRRMVR